MTRAEFITRYVHDCRRVGFAINPTDAGCVYLANGDDVETDEHLVAMPCECGCPEGWGMIEPGGSA